MAKPQFLAEYSPDVTRDCERVLVTLFSGLGPWRESVFLIGGLTPRYLVTARPPEVPAHAGTGDIDVVVDLAVLADTEAYRTLEENLKKMGFERAENDKGVTVNWRWRAKTEHGVTVILEFLADDPKLKGGALQELPTDGNISAINIPHASLVFELHDRTNADPELRPPPADLEVWRAAFAAGKTRGLSPGAAVAALQDMDGQSDRQLRSDLVNFISDRMMAVLRRFVGTNLPRRGLDIIEEVHNDMSHAVLRPNSADGKGLRVAFAARIRLRAATRIAETRKRMASEISDTSPTVQTELAEIEAPDDIEGALDVKLLLETVPDPRKRLAFYLHMQDCPNGGDKGTTTIAGILGISSKTAGEWVDEVRDYLRKKMGEHHDQN